jgi:hypothetical protein
MTRLQAALVSLALLAGCQSATTAARDAAADRAEVACGAGLKFSVSQGLQIICASDSDCQDPYLRCVATMGSVCRDDDSAALANECPSNFLRDVPRCPTQAAVTVKACSVGYEQPCALDSDCGPAGFACMGGICQQTTASCLTAADCPDRWTCFNPCSCEDAGATCHPPLAIYRGCRCMPVADVQDAGVDGDPDG